MCNASEKFPHTLERHRGIAIKLICCVARDKNIDFMAKPYSHIIVAASLNARLNS